MTQKLLRAAAIAALLLGASACNYVQTGGFTAQVCDESGCHPAG